MRHFVEGFGKIEEYGVRLTSCVSLVSVNIASFPGVSTATVALWLRRPPREREVVGSIPGRVLPKTLKWAF